MICWYFKISILIFTNLYLWFIWKCINLHKWGLSNYLVTSLWSENIRGSILCKMLRLNLQPSKWLMFIKVSHVIGKCMFCSGWVPCLLYLVMFADHFVLLYVVLSFLLVYFSVANGGVLKSLIVSVGWLFLPEFR